MQKTTSAFAALTVAPIVALSPETLAQPANTLEEVVVSASRIPTSREQIGSSVSVITEDDIERQQATTVYEALEQVPGLTLTNKGGVGNNTSVRIRGANDGQTLVLIDGMEVNDPSDPSGTFDFGTLSTAAIERIEVLRGPQSSIYGADAMGGVINIITKRGAQGLNARAKAEAGSYDTRSGTASVSGGNRWGDFAFTARRYMTDGISAANAERGATEPDPHRQTTFQGRVGGYPSERLSLDASFRYIDSRTELDASAGTDDLDKRTERLERYGRLSAEYQAFQGRWTQEVGYGYTNIRRSTKPTSFTEWYQGKKEKVDYHSEIRATDSTDLVVGAEYEQARIINESGIDETIDNRAYFGEVRQEVAGAYLSLSGRHDEHDDFGSETTYRSTLSYRVPATRTRLHGSYGTGFKAPTPYQLYSAYGNLQLDPETSRGWDAGVEQPLLDGKLILEATYFHNRFEDLIEFVSFSVGYDNVSEARTRGLEAGFTLEPLERLTVRGSATWLDAENLDTGDELRSRPDRKAHLRLDYRLAGGATVTAQVRHRSEQDDYAGTSDAHTIADLALEVPANDHWSLRGRVENVTDLDYEEVYGYGTRGRSAYVGVAAHY
jgi:vitamin B12 transporter